MELYARQVTIFDKDVIEDFAKEHYRYNEPILAGDGSLISGKTYQEFADFYDWYKEIENLDQEQHLKKGQVGCTTYLVLTKESDQLIALLDIRHSLNYQHGNVYGHLGIDIRPSKRHKGYYKEILKLAITITKMYNIETLVVSCEYTNLVSKKGIEHIFGKEYETIPMEGTYYLVYKMDIRKEE